MRFLLMSTFVLLSNLTLNFISSQAFAQSSSAKIEPTTSQVTPGTESSSIPLRNILGEKKIEDPNVITDQKLKADEGSRSLYSVKFNLGYAGPGITDLGNKDQPNPDHVVNTMQTKLSGTIGARYRIDGVSAVNAGTGITAIHPLHGWDRTDVATPYLSYDRSTRFSEFQIRQTIQGAYVTTPEYVKEGEVVSTYYDLDVVRQLGMSRFSVGLETQLNYFFYGHTYDQANKDDWGGAQTYYAFLPNLKFRVNDRLNLNTYFVQMFYNHRGVSDLSKIDRRTMTQRIGIGYSFAQDIYLSPYITYFPSYPRTDTTTFNLSAVFSIL